MPSSQTHKAFVISPIGSEGQALHSHAKWVREQIIDKACERLLADGHRIQVKRSDDYIEWAHITDEIFERIVEDNIVFVILGGERPNCYFEFGLAIAAGRPVILLKHDEEPQHFDTKDYRATIEYALPSDLREPATEGCIGKVAAAILDRLERPHNVPRVHDRYDPLGRNFVEWRILPKFRDLTLDQYSDFFLASEKRIGLMGITLQHFTNTSVTSYKTDKDKPMDFFNFIRAKILFYACDVSIVMMHESNPALQHLHRRRDEESLRHDVKTTRDGIRESYRKWMRFKTREIDPAPSQRRDERKGSLQVIRLRHGVVHYRLSFTEKELILSPYINSDEGFNSHGPALQVVARSPFYEKIIREFDDLIEQNVSSDLKAGVVEA